jgi:hypothetical protein
MPMAAVKPKNTSIKRYDVAHKENRQITKNTRYKNISTETDQIGPLKD